MVRDSVFFRLTLSRPQTGRVSVHLLIHFCLVPLLVCVVVFPPLSFSFCLFLCCVSGCSVYSF